MSITAVIVGTKSENPEHIKMGQRPQLDANIKILY